MINKSKIAGAKVRLGSIHYQEVITVNEETTYLANVNIIINEKIEAKIRFEAQEKIYKRGMGEKVALDFIKSSISANSDKAATKQQQKNQSIKRKPNQTAGRKVANDLLDQIEIKF